MCSWGPLSLFLLGLRGGPGSLYLAGDPAACFVPVLSSGFKSCGPTSSGAASTGSTSGFRRSSRELWGILRRHKPRGSSRPSESSPLRVLSPSRLGSHPSAPSAQTTARGALHCAPTGPGTHWHLANEVSPTFSDGGGDLSLTPFLEEKTEAQRGWKLDKRAGGASVLLSTRSGT